MFTFLPSLCFINVLFHIYICAFTRRGDDRGIGNGKTKIRVFRARVAHCAVCGFIMS